MWSDQQLAQITTPVVGDERGVALLRTVRDLLQDCGPQKLHVQSAQDCPAEMLPALIADRSMEEFIDPDLPEQTKRDILDREYALKRLKGYDAGVHLGMELLGYEPEIIQWHAQVPMAPPNTHILKIFATVSSGAPYSANDVRAIHRMNDACKRWSQDTELRLSVILPADHESLNVGFAVAVRHRIEIEPYYPKAVTMELDAPTGWSLQSRARYELEEQA